MTSDEQRSEEGRKLWTRALDHLLSLGESNDEVFEDRETMFDVLEVGRIALRKQRLRGGRSDDQATELYVDGRRKGTGLTKPFSCPLILLRRVSISASRDAAIRLETPAPSRTANRSTLDPEAVTTEAKMEDATARREICGQTSNEISSSERV